MAGLDPATQCARIAGAKDSLARGHSPAGWPARRPAMVKKGITGGAILAFPARAASVAQSACARPPPGDDAPFLRADGLPAKRSASGAAGFHHRDCERRSGSWLLLSTTSPPRNWSVAADCVVLSRAD